ncbi:MAG: PAS domain S-box protein [Candidatus Omnitrophica bacterium]|nr:PAS domain S-box protein [Candidatus Omnitrophota bacterium]
MTVVKKRFYFAFFLTLGIAFWLLDATLDYLFFFDDSWWNLFIWNPPAHELFTRLLGIGIFLAGGAFVTGLIDQRNRAQLRMGRLNRTLRAIRNVNQIIASERDPQKLIDRVVTELTGSLSFQTCWIAAVDNHGEFTHFAQSQVGEPFEQLKGLINQKDQLRCMEEVFSSNRTAFFQDVREECRDCPLAKFGIERSGMSHRLMHDDRMLGILTVSVHWKEARDPEFQTLFTEVADDIAFALDRINKDEELSKTQELLHETGQMALVGGWELNLDTGAVHWTPVIFDIFEMDEGTAPELDKTLDLFAPDSQPIFEGALRKAIEEGQPYDIELELITKKGNHRWARAVGLPDWADGKCQRLHGTFQDITDRRKAEMESVAAEHRFQKALKALPFPTILYAEDGEILFVNPAWIEITGYSREAMKDIRGWTELAYGENAISVLEGIEHLFDGDDPVNEGIFEVTTRDGKKRHWDFSSASVGVLPDGRRSKISIVVDVTDRLALEHQLRQAQKMEIVGQLAGGVAHDFNNILQGLLGYADIALDNLEGEEGLLKECLEEIDRGANRAAQLTKQLLAFSRKQVLEPKRIDLNELIPNLLKMIQRTIGEDIHLVYSPSAEPLVIHVDETQLEQVILNLCVNARDAMPAGGKLTLQTESVTVDEDYSDSHFGVAEGEYAQLSVIDTGMGMDSETKKRIFDPFFTTKEVGKGTGLGLSTVYGIVSQHSGFIHVYSEIEEGTAFKVYFPIMDSVVETKRTEQSTEQSPHGDERILLAEDDSGVRSLTKRILSRAGYRVTEVTDGEEAVSFIDQGKERFDLLIVDVVMPKKSGREVTDFYRRRHPNARVLMMSGYTSNQVTSSYIKENGIPFISKPFSRKMLLTKVRHILDAREKPSGDA